MVSERYSDDVNIVGKIINRFDFSQLQENLTKLSSNFLNNLNAVWNTIGLNESVKNKRRELVYKHVENLYEDMLSEEETIKEELKNDIDKLSQELKKLIHDLKVDTALPECNDSLYDQKSKLKFEIEKYKKKYDEKMSLIKNLITQEQNFCRVLGQECKTLSISPLPTQNNIDDFIMYLDELSNEKSKREEIFIKTKDSVTDIIAELNIKLSLEFERNVVYSSHENFILNDENMEKLKNMNIQYENEFKETKEKVEELREKLTTLWELLEENVEVRSRFLKDNPGNSTNTLNALKIEIAKCEEKKKDNIKLYVNKLRQELVVWWDKCRYSPEQRMEFRHFDSDCYTEDLLTLHELQIEKIKSYYQNNKHLFELISKREGILEKIKEWEKKAKDPNRYKNRGGRLLAEEKQRIKISNQLPKIDQELNELTDQYEKDNGKIFLCNGLPIPEIIGTSWEQHRLNQHLTPSAVKQVKGNLKTPTKSQSNISPCKSVQKLKIFNTPAPKSSPSKRKLLDNNAKSLPKKLKYNEDLKMKRNVPKLKITPTGKRVSTEKRRKMTKLRRSKSENELLSITQVIDYDGFKKCPLAESSTYITKLTFDK